MARIGQLAVRDCTREEWRLVLLFDFGDEVSVWGTAWKSDRDWWAMQQPPMRGGSEEGSSFSRDQLIECNVELELLDAVISVVGRGTHMASRKDRKLTASPDVERHRMGRPRPVTACWNLACYSPVTCTCTSLRTGNSPVTTSQNAVGSISGSCIAMLLTVARGQCCLACVIAPDYLTCSGCCESVYPSSAISHQAVIA
ncbi:hypothetical protein BGW36DRAFT_361136 [Talaromyces proteolyticus]|uniref:Uncharacterized protein n=1 Tax=Talaromyces proteolyticus TaxID=1131652 RepID=A0AAD4PZ63_9EURO|nr:uncharacterized protein BGW36DRAFT_361136 [Talaromyces proteolyticus]KAH8695442.1 hypothetical protein BGW36DRAFT_361136 [Talaromyces proteolyticus]